MDFNDYQTKSRKTAGYPAIGHPVIYPTLGLVNEETREALESELGDVLWYVTQMATELDLSLDDIAESNITKLYDRLERGKIKGDGDNR